MTEPLSLCEQLVLLATDEKSGATLSQLGMSLQYCLAGAIFFEMACDGVIEVEDDVVTHLPQEADLDGVYQIAFKGGEKLKKTPKLAKLIQILAGNGRRIHSWILNNLVDRGILIREEKTLLWIFKYQRYPEMEPEPETLIRKRLGEIVSGEISPSESDIVLLGLVKAGNMVGTLFGKDIQKEVEKRIAQITDKDSISSTTNKLIKNMKAALTAITISSAAASSVATTIAINH